ncbi:MAG: MerR family transcriptional regulator [Eubacterium sp.]|nr:MerR family transcriptional regulator [Eubacterium sp.]
MEINEISKRYNIDIKKLKVFEENNLITFREHFTDEDLNMLSALCSLYDSGLSIKEIKDFMAVYNSGEHSGQISFLTECRHNMLNEIHTKQKNLDKLDYIIYELKNKKIAIY